MSFQEVRIRLDRHIEKHLQSVKTRMNKPTGYKKSTNLQAKWPRISVISEDIRESIMSRLEIAARHHNHSLPGEPRTGMISRLELQQGTTTTHFLERQDRHDQQGRIAAKHNSHSQTGEPRTGMISRLEMQQGTTATHFLENQGQA